MLCQPRINKRSGPLFGLHIRRPVRGLAMCSESGLGGHAAIRDRYLGSGLAGTRSTEIVRAYVGAFFDLHLRGRPQPLLERPDPRYPEVGTSSCYS
jgi:hypothetical protein